MKTVVIEVGSLADSLAAFAKTWESGQAERDAHIRFATVEQLWSTLTPKRWQLLQILCGAGAMSIREAARRVGRDVKGPTAKLLAVSTAPQTGCITRRVGTAIVVLWPFKADKVRRPYEEAGRRQGF